MTLIGTKLGLEYELAYRESGWTKAASLHLPRIIDATQSLAMIVIQLDVATHTTVVVSTSKYHTKGQ
jgi:hypothetical protein